MAKENENVVDKVKDKFEDVVDSFKSDDKGESERDSNLDNDFSEVSEMDDSRIHEVDVGVEDNLDDSDVSEQEQRFEDEGGDILHEEGYSVIEDGDSLTVEEGTEIVDESINDFYEVEDEDKQDSGHPTK